ncbi:MAG TPA: phosphatase PAP2 family protein [Sporichthya sp.]|nr:phosphatase PAP2 family protein [Sporichthya sp.]
MRTARWIAAGTGLAFLVLAVLVLVQWSPLMDLDSDVTGRATDLARDHDGYRHVMRAATTVLHSDLILAYALVIAIVLALKGRRATAIWLALVVGLGTPLNVLLKQGFGRARPTVVEPVYTFSGLSFPSGHAASAALIASALAVVFWPGLGRTGRTVLVIAVIAVPLFSAWTRVTLGAHYLSDVVGGILWSVAWVAAWQPALPALERRSSERAVGTR